jgi:glutathione S-transferase
MVFEDLSSIPLSGSCPDMQAEKVPAMDFGGDLVVESNVISEFVADLFPQANLRPMGHSRFSTAKMRQFVEVWQWKVQGLIFAPFFGPSDKDAVTKNVNRLKNYVVPLLQQYNGPYVLGNEFFMGDVLTHSFLLRLFTFAKEGFYGEDIYGQLQEIKGVKHWHDAIATRDSVKKTWNEKAVVDGMKKWLQANQN